MRLKGTFSAGLLNSDLLFTEFAFRTIKYSDQSLEVWSELAKSVRKDQGLDVLQYEKQTWLTKSLLYDTANFTEHLPRIFRKNAKKVFCKDIN